MQKSKLIRLLKILEPEEFKQFPRFIKSPFFNANKQFLPLYNYLKKYYPDFDSSKLQRELIFEKIFPGKEFNYNIYSNLVSGFIRLTEEYLANLQFQKERFEHQKMLLKAYEERTDAFEFFERKVGDLRKELDSSPYRNIHYFKEKFWLEPKWLNHPGVDKYQLEGDDYRQLLNNLDHYFVLEKLRLISELKIREGFLSEKYNLWLFEEIKKKRFDNPLYSIYLDIITLLESNAETDYYRLKSNFEGLLNRFNSKEQQDILQILINYAIGKVNAGNALFFKENFELYKIGLAQDLFRVNGQMNDMIYTNIVGIAVKAEEFSWCYDFLNEYETYLDKKVRKDAQSLSLGIWYYYQNNIKEAIDHLHDFDFINDFYQIRGRSLLLKIYFEQFLKDNSYYDLLVMQCLSFEKYIRRNNVLATSKEKAYLDFISLLKKLSKSIMNFKITPALKSNWLDQIQSKSYLYGQDWLKEQIQML